VFGYGDSLEYPAVEYEENDMKIPLFTKKQEFAVDPVCHMQVDIDNPGGGTAAHEGKTYYFCGNGCRVVFQKEPQAYLSGEKSMKM
jgi:YHS domain-containing protein